MGLRRNDPVPLYAQLAEQLRDEIERELKPGDRLPSVRALGERHAISPMTVRQALGQLLRDGLLEVRRGAGTYVASPKITHDLSSLAGFSEDMQGLGMSSETVLLAQGLEQPLGRIRELLQLQPGERVVHVTRLRHAGGVPTVLDESYVPSTLCPGLEQADLEHNSLYDLMERSYGLALAYADQVMDAVSANALEAERLEVPLNTPLFMMSGVTYLANNQPVEFFKARYRSDRIKFQIRLERRFRSGDGHAGPDGRALHPLARR